MKDSMKLFIVLHHAFKSIDVSAHRHIRDYGISITEFGVLEVLYHRGKQTINQLRERVLVASSSISYVVQELEADGFVKKEKCNKDKRVTYIHLTREGRALITKIFPDHTAIIDEIMSDLSSEDIAQLTEWLKIIGKKAKHMHDE